MFVLLALLLFFLPIPSHSWYTDPTGQYNSVTDYTTRYNLGGVFTEVVLGPRDEAGSFLLVNSENGKPYCDDYWNDVEAESLCKRWQYKHGRRAARTVDKTNFYAIIPSCYYWRVYLDPYLMTSETCMDAQPIPDTFGCAEDQAAAVFCWNVDWEDDFQYISHTSSKKKWTLKVAMHNVKYGRKYNVVGDDSLIGKPKGKDFVAKGCGKSVKVNVKTEKKKEVLTLKGKWAKKCDKCFEFYYKGNKFLSDVCVSRRVISN